jgi:hypothetical protein
MEQGPLEKLTVAQLLEISGILLNPYIYDCLHDPSVVPLVSHICVGDIISSCFWAEFLYSSSAL